MPTTLLLGGSQHRWSSWLEQNLGRRPLLVLDPANAEFGTPGCVTLVQGGERKDWRFVGSIDPSRQPMSLLAAAAEFRETDHLVALTFAPRPNPTARQLLQAIAQVIGPSEILGPKDEAWEREGWPVGPAEVTLDKALPSVVNQAQRRARWIEAQEDSSLIDVRLGEVTTQGARLGGGELLHRDPFWAKEFPEVIWAERAAGTLLLVCKGHLNDDQVGVATRHAECARVQLAHESDYEHLFCALCRENGEHLAPGFIERADLAKERLIVRANVTENAGVRLLKIGSLRVDGEGRELGECKPWSI